MAKAKKKSPTSAKASELKMWKLSKPEQRELFARLREAIERGET